MYSVVIVWFCVQVIKMSVTNLLHPETLTVEELSSALQKVNDRSVNWSLIGLLAYTKTFLLIENIGSKDG